MKDMNQKRKLSKVQIQQKKGNDKNQSINKAITKVIEKVNESWFSEVNKIDGLLARLIKKKRKRLTDASEIKGSEGLLRIIICQQL